MGTATTDYRGRAGLRRLREDVSASLVPQQLRAEDPDRFAASLRTSQLGAVQLIDGTVPALRARRSRSQAVRSGTGRVSLLLGDRVGAALHHDDGVLGVDDHHLAVIGDDQAFDVTYRATARVVFLTLEQDVLARRCGIGAGPVRSIPIGRPAGRVLRAALDLPLAGAAAADELAAVLLGVVRLASGSALDHDEAGLAGLRARCTAMVEANLGEPALSPGWLAARTHTSVRQVHRAFAEAGETPAEVIRTRRLERAAALLASTDLTVAEVARRLAFSSPAHLSRRFSEHHGVPPSTWRASHR